MWEKFEGWGAKERRFLLLQAPRPSLLNSSVELLQGIIVRKTPLSLSLFRFFLLGRFYTQNDDEFTKTGSGQTYRKT
jgi:hypothetical protein